MGARFVGSGCMGARFVGWMLWVPGPGWVTAVGAGMELPLVANRMFLMPNTRE